MRKLGLLTLAAIAALGAIGCGIEDSEVSRSDAERNKQEFSQENYEKAMKAAGKEKELEEEKRRAEQYNQGGQ